MGPCRSGLSGSRSGQTSDRASGACHGQLQGRPRPHPRAANRHLGDRRGTGRRRRPGGAARRGDRVGRLDAALTPCLRRHRRPAGRSQAHEEHQHHRFCACGVRPVGCPVATYPVLTTWNASASRSDGSPASAVFGAIRSPSSPYRLGLLPTWLRCARTAATLRSNVSVIST